MMNHRPKQDENCYDDNYNNRQRETEWTKYRARKENNSQVNHQLADLNNNRESALVMSPQYEDKHMKKQHRRLRPQPNSAMVALDITKINEGVVYDNKGRGIRKISVIEDEKQQCRTISPNINRGDLPRREKNPRNIYSLTNQQNGPAVKNISPSNENLLGFENHHTQNPSHNEAKRRVSKFSSIAYSQNKLNGSELIRAGSNQYESLDRRLPRRSNMRNSLQYQPQIQKPVRAWMKM